MQDIKLGKFQLFNRGLTIDDLSFENGIDVVYNNFHINSSVKLIPFFEKIKKSELKNLLKIFSDKGIDLSLHDVLGLLHVVILKILIDSNKKQVLIINDIGFAKESIDFLQTNFKGLMSKKFINKSILIYTDDIPEVKIHDFFIKK